MRNFLSTAFKVFSRSFILAVVLFTCTHTVHAQEDRSILETTIGATIPGSGQIIGSAVDFGLDKLTSGATGAVSMGIGEISSTIKKFISGVILSIFAGFLQVCSMIFEATVYIGVVKFSDLVGKGQDSWINTIWGIVRDILNIGVIFVLLYAAIKVIVGRGGEIKKLIAGVIVFGVLTNFSLFFTKAAVDISNVIALEFYNQMRVEKDIGTISFSDGLGATIVNATGLVRFYTEPDITTGAGGGLGNDPRIAALQDSFVFLFAMIIVFIAVGFMFLQAAFIFIGRAITLIFLLIFSPLMFAGGVFTPLQKWTEKWHKEFIGQTVLAPIFFILLYVAITVLTNITKSIDEQIGIIEKQDGSFFVGLVVILISTGLVIFAFSLALNQAKEWAGSIGGKFSEYGNSFNGLITRKTFDGTSAGLRSASVLTGARKLSNWAENAQGWSGSFARGLKLDKIKNSTLDIRNTKVGGALGKGVSAALSASGVDMSAIKAGTGSTNKVQDVKSIIQASKDKWKKVQENTQKRADVRGERLVENKLKEIEEDLEKKGVQDTYAATDFKIALTDAKGNISDIERQDISDEDWAKEVKRVNKLNRKYIDEQKNTYLKDTPALLVRARGRNFVSRRGVVAEYKAREKFAKKFKDDPERQLRSYTDDLEKYTDLLGVTKEQIQSMKEEEVLASWNDIKSYKEAQLKKHETAKPTDQNSKEYADWTRDKRKIDIDLGKAKAASKKVTELKKKIDAGKKKDSPKKDSDSKDDPKK